ncbi:hypothetical protein GU920_00175 [Rhodobacter sp. CCP-1]|uniref:Uncharacterized protein n=1 Tax=Paragemmobacter ruber TaxID=1985673 RepID=A0ABW9Y1U9_9RHOB|nr:hypothetical protein [Rhodobacter ruber]
MRELLIDRLDRAGMIRRKGMTEAEHRDWLGKMVDRLAYMSRANLAVLAESLLAMGGGRGRNEWPSEVAILTFAEGLQKRPAHDLPLVQSWLRSIEGPAALAGGFEVELLRYLRKCRRPPMAMDMARIRAEAADNRRWVAMAEDRVARGVERPEDRGFLEAYTRDRDFARGLIAAGQERRDEKGAA